MVARAVDILAAMGSAVATSTHFPTRDCATMIRFLREFVVAVHLRKEANFLLPALAMHADNRRAERVGELFRLHEEVVDLSHTLMLFWEPREELSAEERSGFAEAIAALCWRLQRLQAIEEAELFTFAEAAIPADDRLQWHEEFERIDRERGRREAWNTTLQALWARWVDAS